MLLVSLVYKFLKKSKKGEAVIACWFVVVLLVVQSSSLTLSYQERNFRVYDSLTPLVLIGLWKSRIKMKAKLPL